MNLSLICLLLVVSLAGPMAANALPGDVASGVVPRFATPVDHAEACLDGFQTIHLWSSFHTLDGEETAGVIRLAPDGTTDAVLAPGLLPAPGPDLIPVGSTFPAGGMFRCLADGRLMICTADQGGVLITPSGSASAGFFQDLPTGIRIAPQFERGGFLYFIITQADGTRALARQSASAVAWAPVVLPGSGWPLPPAGAVPGPGDSIRILGASATNTLFDFTIQQRVFLVDDAGQLVPDAPIFDPALNRTAIMTATPDGGYRLVFGVDPTIHLYWPSPTSFERRIEWRGSDHALIRTLTILAPLFQFVFAEESGGRVLATSQNGELSRFNSDGTPDPTFTSPGYVSSILPLPGGLWLVNGLRRIMADGAPDPIWHQPVLETPSGITHLACTPGGGVIVAGDFRKLDGTTVPGLVKLTADGTPFPGFTPDPRLGQVTALAAMPDDAIALGVTSALTLADGRSTALLRLLPNGTIDETAFPQAISTPGITMPRSTIAQLACQADGRLLMFSETYGGEVSTSTLSRRLPDLSVDSSFAVGSNYSVASPRLLPLADGRIFVGSKLLDAGGHLLEDIARPDQGSYSPQCQMADGAVVFTTLSQTGGTTSNKLVRWKSGTWDSSFEAAVNSPVGALGAVAVPDGKLYVTGWLAGGVPPGTQLVRLHRNGRLDAAFLPPPLTRQIRRGPGPWFTHTPTGLASFDPVAAATPAWGPIVRWHSPTNRLWLAGSFNMAGATACDGLVALDGTNATGYLAWSQAALRDLPSHAGADQDPDGDGCSNFLEYAAAGNPRVPDAASCTPQAVPGTPLQFSLWKNPEAVEVYPIVRTSVDLTQWRTATGSEIMLDSSSARVIFKLLPGAPRRFVRIEFIEL